MRYWILFATSVFLALGAISCGGGNRGPENIFITGEEDSGRTVTMGVGDELQVMLSANHTLNFAWSIVTNDETVLPRSGEPSYVIDNPDVDGGGGTATYTFRAAAPGTSVLRLIYAEEQGGAAVEPLKIFELTVNVVE